MKNAIRSIGWMLVGGFSLLSILGVIDLGFRDDGTSMGIILILFSLTTDVDKIP